MGECTDQDVRVVNLDDIGDDLLLEQPWCTTQESSWSKTHRNSSIPFGCQDTMSTEPSREHHACGGVHPTDEPVHLFKYTTLGILTPLHEMTNIKVETIDAKTVDASIVGQVGWVWSGKQSLPEEIQKLVGDSRQTLTQEQGELRLLANQAHRGNQGQDFTLWSRRRLLEIPSHTF